MQINLIYTIALFICTILLGCILVTVLNNKRKKLLDFSFCLFISCLIICCIGQLFLLVFAEQFNINPIYFDYFVYIGTCFLPVAFLFFGLIFAKSEFKFKKKYFLLFIIPILSLLILWTNDFHHLFYVTYNTSTELTEFGPYFYVHSIYSFILIFTGLLYLVKYTIRNAVFFSKQSILIIIGVSIPIIINLLGILGVPMTIFQTPIAFTISALFFALAIVKFKFLTIAPIALQKIVDRMSDGYVVLNDELIITDFNETFFKVFNISEKHLRNSKFFSDRALKYISYEDLTIIKHFVLKSRNDKNTYSTQIQTVNGKNFYTVEVASISSDNHFLGTLILFKDITQHILDLDQIKNNQNLLMEKERLASLGQLIGGIAHNLKTPIMSISGATEGLSDLIKEYDSSIGDPDVNNNDHHAIAKDMFEWVNKIKSYTEYMSDVITTVKGQAVTLSENKTTSFDLDELVKRVNILMKHELKNALIVLNVQFNTDKSTLLHGDITSLVQVINNMISNSIQSYNGQPNKSIDFVISRANDSIILSIRDYGCGLSDKVKQKLFKEMITTKGKNGTGLGLFMSYSTIRAHFNGNITFESEEGKGTTFNIVIPCK